ncbi:hypothetical protein CBS101457_000669 [Exobasidium rhododendri]|nr:hypothetical protein CBS101457_000669 [Exobasidium rhododendri]
MTDAQAQDVALNILGQLDLLVEHGKLQAHQTLDIRSHLEALARPRPPPIVGRKPPTIPQSTSLRQCKAIWSYSGAEADELTFEENDRIEIIEEVDAAWWKGCVVHADTGRSQAGLFPSNYVESIQEVALLSKSPPPPARNVPPIYTSPIHPDQSSTYNDDKQQLQGYHGQLMTMPSPYSNQNHSSLGPPAWQPGVARWSSGAPPAAIPAPPPSQAGYASPSPSSHGPPSPAPSNTGYYQQVATQGPSDQQPHSSQQPVVQTMEERKKHEKLKKFGGRMGQTMAGGFAGGIGFGIGSHLFD